MSALCVSFRRAELSLLGDAVRVIDLDARKSTRQFVNISRSTVSGIVALGGDGAGVNAPLVVATWDNRVYIYSPDYGAVVDQLDAHDDAVACIAVRDSLLASGSWDSSLRIWCDFLLLLFLSQNIFLFFCSLRTGRCARVVSSLIASRACVGRTCCCARLDFFHSCHQNDRVSERAAARRDRRHWLSRRRRRLVSSFLSRLGVFV